MARIARIPLSFLSTAIFFGAFVLAGDVLVAATVAVITAIAQLAIRRSVYRNESFLIWASLALVIALTGLTLKGDDAHAAALSQVQMIQQGNGHIAQCGCRVSSYATEAKISAAPTL